MLEELSPEAIASLVASLPGMPLAEKEALLNELESLEHKKALKKCREDFLAFCAYIYPEWKEGPHHRYMKPLLHKVRDGVETRLTVSMPPRFGKSETIAYLFVAWYLGHWPNHHIMMATHTAALSADFGRKVRNLLETDKYKEVFPNTAVSKDKSAADNWTTTAGGKYLAIGIGANVAGHGAHLLVIDDLCIYKNSIVHTLHGDVPAHKVVVGDYLLGEAGWQQVIRKTTSEHATSVCIDGLRMSNEHPVWTFNSGWQRASAVNLGDMLRTTTFWCKIKSSILRGLKNVTTSETVRSVQAGVQHLGDDEAAVQQPQGRQLHQLWRGGDQGVSRVRDVFGVFANSRPGAINQTHAGSHRQRAGVHGAELPLGRRGDAAEQPNERGSLCVPGEDVVITAVGEDCRHTDSENGAPAKGAQDDCRIRDCVAETELGAAPRKTDDFGWGVGAAVRLFGFSSRLRRAAELAENNQALGRGSNKLKTAGLRWVQGAVVLGLESIAAGLGVLVGVRRVSRVEHIGTADQFVNFEVRGDNTFFAQGILTHNCSEQAVLSNPDAAFATAWEYIQVGPLQRLMPGGRIVMIGCMTAETRVLMADGSEKELPHIQVGDAIATYDAGKITTSRVTNWIEHLPDYVYRIRTTSGTTVRANKRHPFLVDRDGVRTWIRVRDLKVGDCLVKAVQPKDVCAQDRPKGCVVPATKTKRGLKGRRDQLLRRQPEQRQKPKQLTNTLSDGRVDGKGWSAPLMGVAAPSLQKGFAIAATAKRLGVQVNTALRKSKSAAAILSTGMASLRKLTTLCLRLKEAVVQSASGPQPQKTQGPAGRQNSTLTIATKQTVSEDFCATTATWPSGTLTPSRCSSKLPHTYATTPDAIVEIVEDGFEPVYDLEVERTENFIANGVVSHNTRWGRKDPIGRALAWAENNPNSTPWNEVRFPAILPQSGKSLWPEQWPLDQLLAKKAGMQPQFWAAQYMQEPTSEEGAILKREWWQIWEKENPPDVEFVMQVWDTAHDTKSHNDFSACITWGVFFNETTNRHELIMLNAIKGRWEFPQLKQKALDEYKEWQPECLLIEKKAAGAPLIQELRQMDMIIEEYSPSRAGAGVSNDKRARVNSVAPLLFDKVVWAPDHRWAFEVINECAEFPHGENDDYVDVCAMALARYRRGGFVSLSSDRKDEPQLFRRRSAAYY